MKKFLLIGAAALMVSNSTFAGGILTNTNQNAAFLRNPARDAIIAIDGVYSNPAGIAFLPQGFHLSVSWQAAFQKRQIDATGKMFMMNANNQSADRYFEGTAKAPVIPSIQAATLSMTSGLYQVSLPSVEVAVSANSTMVCQCLKK